MGYRLPPPIIPIVAESARSKLERTYRSVICTPWGLLRASPPYGPDFLPYDDLYECWHTLMPHSGSREEFNLRYLKDILPTKGYNPRIEPKNFWQLYLNHIDHLYDTDPNKLDDDERKLVKSERKVSEAQAYEEGDEKRRLDRVNVEVVLQCLEDDLNDGRLVLPAGRIGDEEMEVSHESNGAVVCAQYDTAEIAEDMTDNDWGNEEGEIIGEVLNDEFTGPDDSDDESMASDQVRGDSDDTDVDCNDSYDKLVATNEAKGHADEGLGQGAGTLDCMK
ncbi:MAG: hypothetical protein Q9213_007340 [Squamulea squamosa]